jgi:hypothetical protein
MLFPVVGRAVCNPERIDYMQNFVEAIIPSLKGQDLQMTIRKPSLHVRSVDSELEVSFSKPQPCCVGGISGDIFSSTARTGKQPLAATSERLERKETLVCIASFRFKNGELWGFTGHTLPDHLTEVVELVNKHPQWSDAEVIGALKHAGAHYGPWNRQSFVALLRHQPLEHYLGPLKVEHVEFQTREETPLVNGLHPADLYWHVDARAQNGRGYVLLYEPFYGRLFGLITKEQPRQRGL